MVLLKNRETPRPWFFPFFRYRVWTFSVLFRPQGRETQSTVKISPKQDGYRGKRESKCFTWRPQGAQWGMCLSASQLLESHPVSLREKTLDSIDVKCQTLLSPSYVWTGPLLKIPRSSEKCSRTLTVCITLRLLPAATLLTFITRFTFLPHAELCEEEMSHFG